MHDKMKKMLHKKRDLNPNEKHARMNVVKHLRDMASEDMGHKLDGLKKVSVMSDNQHGLEKGLDKAKQIVSNPEMKSLVEGAENPYSGAEPFAEGGEVEESPEHEMSESPLEESQEHDLSEFHGLDMDQIDEKLQQLMELKRQMEAKES